jgi:hypothetical protein
LLWSDVFDCHPTTTDRADNLYTASPAAETSHFGNPTFRGMQSPYVSAKDARMMPDRFLYRALAKEWHRRFVSPAHDDQFSRTLFRSLEVAYRASSVGRVALATIHDYGIQIGLWVSAMEILAWPDHQYASLDHVAALLGKYHWSGEKLRARRYRIGVGRNRRAVNAVQKVYWYLNAARNDFLHGNPVSIHSLKSGGTPESWLPRLAAIVYRTVLAQYLSGRYAKMPRRQSEKRELFAGLWDGANYESALSAQL